MSNTITTCNIRDTYDLTSMRHIMTGLIGLHLTWAFTTLRYIRASVHPVHRGLSIHGPVGPYLSSGDADSGDSSTTCVRAVEVQTATHLGGGSGNDYIGGTLRHNPWHV
nr:AC5 protein [Pepper leaf curl Yunnan virus]